jgi:hypothetical protein
MIMSQVLFDAKPGKQISVLLENVPGTLSSVVHLLGGEGINILALSLAEGLDHGYVRMVVDQHDKAVQILKDKGGLVLIRDVVLLELANRAGSLAEISSIWAKAGINIEYAYCANSPSVDKGLVVLKVDDTAKALKVLKG